MLRLGSPGFPALTSAPAAFQSSLASCADSKVSAERSQRHQTVLNCLIDMAFTCDDIDTEPFGRN